MVELLATDSVDLAGEADGTLDFSIDCPGEEEVNGGKSLLFIVLKPGLSELSANGVFIPWLLPLLDEFGRFASGVDDLSFSPSFLLMEGIIFLDGDMSFPMLLQV